MIAVCIEEHETPDGSDYWSVLPSCLWQYRKDVLFIGRNSPSFSNLPFVLVPYVTGPSCEFCCWAAETKGTDRVGMVIKLAAVSENGTGERSCLGELLGIINKSGMPQHG